MNILTLFGSIGIVFIIAIALSMIPQYLIWKYGQSKQKRRKEEHK